MSRWHALLLLALPACEEKKHAPPAVDQTASITVVSSSDGGQATNAMMIGETDAFPLPAGDVPAVGRQPELRAPGVYVVRLADGTSRPAYLGTVSLFFGAKIPNEEAHGKLTFLAGAAAAWADPGARPKVLQVARERALGEVPALLALVADQPGPEWREAFLALAPAERAELADALPIATTPAPRLLAAVLAGDLDAQPDVVLARFRGGEVDHLTAALMLRSLGSTRPAEAETIACTLLTLPHGDPLLGAALLALRSKTPKCAAHELVVRDACAADARCANGSPLTEAPKSSANEPTCSKDETRLAADREATKTKWDVVRDPAAPTAALALALETRALPGLFVAANARRHYAVDQHGPACAGAEVGASCTESEAELRLAACRTHLPTASTALATFAIDASQRQLRDVKRAP